MNRMCGTVRIWPTEVTGGRRRWDSARRPRPAGSGHFHSCQCDGVMFCPCDRVPAEYAAPRHRKRHLSRYAPETVTSASRELRLASAPPRINDASSMVIRRSRKSLQFGRCRLCRVLLRPPPTVELCSVLTCPHCGYDNQEVIPTTACPFLKMRKLWCYHQAQDWRLLRLLLLWLGEMPAGAGEKRLLRMKSIHLTTPC